MKVWKKILWLLLVIFIVIQFFKPEKNIASTIQANNISKHYQVPSNVQTILGKACYDCHSNNTRYPWYNNIQPVAWWLNNHIQEGKRELNFDEFCSYKIGRQYHKLEGAVKEVKEGEMPLGSYTIIHTDARLSDVEKKLLINWFQAIRDTIKANYPADSLLQPKRN